MEKGSFFAYKWHIDDNEDEITTIRVYGINESGENVCLKIDDFTPYVYLELPEHINWTDAKALLLSNKIDELSRERAPIKRVLMKKRKLYGSHRDSKGKHKLFPFLFCAFSTKEDIKQLSYKIRKPMIIAGIGKVYIKMHENNANPILQLTCCKDIPVSGWIDFKGKRVSAEHSKLTLCEHEFEVSYKRLTKNCKINKPADPLVMGFDIEVNSTNPSAMPKSHKPGDKVFQVACIISRTSDNPSKYRKILLSLGDPDQEKTGKDVKIITFKTEAGLLEGFTELVRKENVNIIVGYNILCFDIPYMIDRAKHNSNIYNFDQMGFHKFGHAREKTIKWSSSAYKNQEFQYLDAEGRLFVDLLPLVNRSYKMDNYRLKTVSTHFLGETKDPLSVKGIFKCYRIGMKGGKQGRKAMAIVGKYCLAENTKISTCHGNISIQDFYGQNIDVLSWNEDTNTLAPSLQSNFFDNGKRKCIELTLYDGRTITCTGEHRLACEKGWVNSRDILPGQRVKIGPILPDIELDTAKTIYSRVLGYIITDGHVSKDRVVAYFGNILDMQIFCDDIQKISGVYPNTRKCRNCMVVSLPLHLIYKINRENWLTKGNRTKGNVCLPDTSEWDRPMVREFLGGMFGGDGGCTCYCPQNKKLSPITFTQSRSTMASIEKFMKQITEMLGMFGIKSSVKISRRNSIYIGVLKLPMSSTEKFMENIGYRYCYGKVLKSSVGVLYIRVKNRIKNGYRDFFEKVKKSGKSVSIAYSQYKDDYEYPPKYGTMKSWIANGFPEKRPELLSRDFPDIEQFIKDIGAENVFVSEKFHSYALKKGEDCLPVFSIPLISKKDIGTMQVYDITVEDTHSMLANGIVAHNCVQDAALCNRLLTHLHTWSDLTEMSKICNVQPFTLYTQGQQIKVFSQVYKYCMQHNIVVEKDGYVTKDTDHYVGAHVFDPIAGYHKNVVPFDFASLYPTTIIAYNIDYTTWVTDENVPDEKCNVMEWEDHIGCIVKDTPISLSDRALRIQDSKENNEELYALDSSGIGKFQQTNFFDQGVKECVKITLMDGTELKCTPDHRVLTENGWVEAQDIEYGKRVKIGYNPPLYDIPEDFEFIFADDTYKGQNIVKLMQIFGLILSNGHISNRRTKLYVEHKLDIQNVKNTFRCLFGVTPVSKKENCGWSIPLPGKYGIAFQNFKGVQNRELPEFIFNSKNPTGMVNAFLSGFFGGGGHTLSYSDSFSNISIPKRLSKFFEKLKSLLKLSDIYSTITQETKLIIQKSDILKFHKHIGFAHCVNKSIKLEAGCVYLRYQQMIKKGKHMKTYVDFSGPMEYMKFIGAGDLFSKGDLIQEHLPVFSVPLIFREDIGLHQTYDIEVDTSHSFIANGIIVHNCNHDPKVVRKKEIDKIIDNVNIKLKEFRKQRDAIKDKASKQSYKIKIDEMIEDLKPYRKERAELNKCKPKHIMCIKRKYRFEKEPLGVIPTIIQNLLAARKNIRKGGEGSISYNKKKMGELKAQLAGLTGKKLEQIEAEIEEIAGTNAVLDKRQLACKLSSNSMYGAFGVRKGYIPFMPGAMCLGLDSQISFGYGFTRKIKDLVDTNNLWSYNDGQIVSTGKGLKYNGKRGIVKITLVDGRVLKCTPDHKIMTKDGWVEAGKLTPKHFWTGDDLNIVDNSSKVICGLELPEDVMSEDENEWKILNYTMDTPENREKTLAFCRLLGFILSDGSISKYNNKYGKAIISMSASLGTLLSAKMYVNDIRLLTGLKPTITDVERNDMKGNSFKVNIPTKLAKQILTLEGIMIGKRTHQPFTLPEFLFKEDCPLSIAREFLGGFFGGDGTAPSLSISHPSFSPVQFDLSTIEKYKDDMHIVMKKLAKLLSRFGLNFWCVEPKLARIRTYTNISVDIKENPRWVYLLTSKSSDSLKFAEKIGFRYDIDKANKLSVAASYQRYSNNTAEQHKNVVVLASDIADKNNKKINMKHCLEKAREELYENTIPMHSRYSLAKPADIYNHRSRPHSLANVKLLSKFFPTAREYVRSIGCNHWFSESKHKRHVYSCDRMDEVNQCFYLDVLDIRRDGEEDVYDIIDTPHSSFMANGMVVHNCTTYMGRTNIDKVATVIPQKYGGKLIYGDTDSNYIIFPHLKTAQETWDYAEEVADEVTKLFPKPIQLEFEEEIYKDFFILTKKRYMYRKCLRDGVVSDKIGRKGVLLARRDNSGFVRNAYEETITKIFDHESWQDIEYFVLQKINQLCSGVIPISDFTVTKSVGDSGGLEHESFVDEKGKKKWKVGDYKIPPLSADKEEREEQLMKKEAKNVKEYCLLSLPAQVQLAEKMRRRGQRVDNGSRLEYVITTNGGHNAKQGIKLESFDYFSRHKRVLEIDYMYYLKLFSNPMDQLLNVAFGKEKKYKEDMVLEQYKYRLRVRGKCLRELENIFSSGVVIEE